jgi:hypothetical protein
MTVYTKNCGPGKIFLQPKAEARRSPVLGAATPGKEFPRAGKSGMILFHKETLGGKLAGCREN